MMRLLGSSWASVHGPAEPRRLAVWLLELGFGGIAAGPAPRPIDWLGLRSAVRDLPFAWAGAWRLAPAGQVVGRVDAGLAAPRAGAVAEAIAAVGGGVDQASRLGLRAVVLEPGMVRLPVEPADLDLTDGGASWGPDRAAAVRAQWRAGLDAALDRACRSLHRICKSWPEQQFCLTLSGSAAGLGTPESLAAIFEDLSGCRLGYWHDTALAAAREAVFGEPQGDALERFVARMGGVTAGDWAPGELLLPPGAGRVDYPLVGSYLRSRGGSIEVVVDLDPAVSPGEIPGVHSFLSKSGL
jgi:hypothetical protein